MWCGFGPHLFGLLFGIVLGGTSAMNMSTTILTVGTALRHAHNNDSPVHVLCGTTWMTGRVIGLDGEGVALYTPDEETLVVRIAGISAVRIKSGVVEVPEDRSKRSQYDGLKFPTTLASDLSTLGVTTTPPVREPEPEPAPVVSPYPVGHPARTAGR